MSLFADARREFHKELLETGVLGLNDNNVVSNADSSNRISKLFARGIYDRLLTEETLSQSRLAGQTSGRNFERICATFIETCFSSLSHLRPGSWSVLADGPRNIAHFEQYSHLVALTLAAKKDPVLAAALQSDYTITPDVVIVRHLESDESINSGSVLVDEGVARFSTLRKINGAKDLLHASISCKWTIRSDRVQNTRAEALNLVRNRKGRLPHIVAITGEPLPSRIAAIALGTGDVDCVYHFALRELMEAVAESDSGEAANIIDIMVDGKRLRDISDLPLDLAV